MTDNERLQFAAQQLANRIAMMAVDAVNWQTEAEAQKRRADALQERLDKLKPAEATA